MRHLKNFLTVLLICCPVFAAETAQQKLHEAFVLDQQGRFKEVIAVAKPLTETASSKLSEIDLGRAYLILGVAYEQAGNINESERAYEKSLRILEPHREDLNDYAATLDNFAGLYNETGRFEAAGQMWLASLRIREQIGDHGGAVRSLSNLTGFALSQQHVHEAKRYMKRAWRETKLAHDLTDDDIAVLFETQAWLFLSEGNASSAVAAYRRALEISRRSRGEQHWITGWEYMLLGKAYAENGDLKKASDNMHQGLAILEQALGPNGSKFLVAEIAYSQLLDRSGSHAEAAKLKAAAEKTATQIYAGQCVGCTINVAGFR